MGPVDGPELLLQRAPAADVDPRLRHPPRRAAGRPRGDDQPPPDGGRRLGRDARGHHRAAAHRGAHPPSRAARCADRPAQPLRLPRGDGQGREPHQARRDDGGPLHRPRPLQGRQRHARATPSATQCLSRSPSGCEARRAKATSSPGSAATSSPSLPGTLDGPQARRGDRRPHRQVDGAADHDRRPSGRSSAPASASPSRRTTASMAKRC